MTSFLSGLEYIPLAVWLSVPIAAFTAFIISRGGLRWQTLKNIRGPAPGSWLYGHQIELQSQKEVGELDFNWVNEYGGAWKIDGCFGRNILMVSDPGAIRHIIHTMGYAYPMMKEIEVVASFSVGRGILWARGDRHVRHRKLLNPVFTTQAQRPFYAVFRRFAAQLTSRWRDKLQEGDCSDFQTMNINRGLADTTLDVIGETVFDYHFGALDEKAEKNEFSELLHNLFTASTLSPPKSAILFSASWVYWPEFMLRYIGDLPFRQFIRFKQFLTSGKRLGKELIANMATVVDGKKRTDILSILVEANKSSNSKADHLSEDELLSQITTLIVGGYETTASTLTWILYELAKHPEDQTRVREEIGAKRLEISANGQTDFTPTDLENLLFTNAVIKEGLRMHPIVPWIQREAAGDDVVPLSEPIIGSDGTTISKIEVTAGQPVFISTCAYNRRPGTWGLDAHQWRPDRHLEDTNDKQIPIGLYANVLTFSGGPSGCIGWRFALTEMQAIAVELIENFEFSAPPDDIKILRARIGTLMTPMVEGRMDEGTQMPLGVRAL